MRMIKIFALVCLIIILLLGCQPKSETFEDEPIQVEKIETVDDKITTETVKFDELIQAEKDSEETIVDTPVDTPEEVPKETPKETPVETPAEVPKEAPINYSVETILYQEESKLDVVLQAKMDEKVLWNVVWTDLYITELSSHSGFVIDGDRLYIEVEGYLQCLNRSTGVAVFEPVFVGATTVPVVDEVGNIYCEGYYGPFLTKVTPEGAIAWSLDEPENAMWPWNLRIEGEYIYVSYESFEVTEYNLAQVHKESGRINQFYWQEQDEIIFENLTISSALKDYPASNVLDGLSETGWVEGQPDDGGGEWLKFDGDVEKEVSKIEIQNGYHKSENLYYANNRIKVLEVILSDGTLFTYELTDTMKPIELFFNRPVKTKSIKLKIVSVYPGTKYRDTVISGVSFY